MAKKKDMLDSIADEMDAKQTYNPLLMALRENDKKNLFKTNVTTAFMKTGFHLFDYYFGSVINVHDDLGKIIKQEPRVGQAAGTFNLIIGNSGTGKMQPDSTPIPTPSGWKQLKDIQEGDEVFSRDGKPTIVDGVFPHGEKDIYKITFSDGRTALCGLDHLWEVETIKKGEIVRKVVDTKTMLSNYKNFDDPESNKRRYKVPYLEKSIKYPDKEVPMDPYVLGVFIANGMLNKEYLSISSSIHKDIIDYICNKYDFEVRFVEPAPEVYVFYKHGKEVTTVDFFKNLPELVGVPSDRLYIPDVYKINSPIKRISVLNGLFDAKGIIATNNRKYTTQICSNSRLLLEDITEVIRSLTYNATINECKINKLSKDEFDGILTVHSYHVFKSGLFRFRYKELSDEFLSAPETFEPSALVQEIEYSHKESARCIHVTHPSHLYVTDQFVLTHNTTLASQIAANIIRQYKYANVIHFDCENRFDISRCETITHLPASFFDADKGERYMIRTGLVGLDVIQEMIVKTYVNKMKLKEVLMVPSGFKDEFGKEVMIFEPTVIIIDSITTVLNETFNPDSAKEASDAEKMRGNTEGARDAKSLKGFFKDIIPLCKEANIIVYGINHINQNMSMNAFTPVAKQQNYLKQDESIPGGKTMIYYPFNIVKLTARPSDDFTEEGDGFAGHMVMVEPIKSSSNQSGNNSKGVSFEMVFSHKYGFDPLRTLIMYGRNNGIIEGNRNRLKFKEDDSFTFTMKGLMKEKDEKPIWESIKSYIIPTLEKHLSFVEPNNGFDERLFDY